MKIYLVMIFFLHIPYGTEDTATYMKKSLSTQHGNTQRHTTTNSSSPTHQAIDLWSSTTDCLSDKWQAAVRIARSVTRNADATMPPDFTRVEDAHWQHFLGVRRLIRIDYGGTSVSWSSCVDFHPSWRDKIWRSRVKKSKNQFYPMRRDKNRTTAKVGFDELPSFGCNNLVPTWQQPGTNFSDGEDNDKSEKDEHEKSISDVKNILNFIVIP